MLELVNSENIEDLLNISKRLLPYYKNSISFFEKIEKIQNLEELEELHKKIKNEIFI
jgi:hypothetical protein